MNNNEKNLIVSEIKKRMDEIKTRFNEIEEFLVLLGDSGQDVWMVPQEEHTRLNLDHMRHDGQPSSNGAFECKGCKKLFDCETCVDIHQSRVHGYATTNLLAHVSKESETCR